MLEAALLTRKWDAILGDGTLTSFADTSLLMGTQNVAPITGWDKAASQLEAFAVFCTVFLGYYGFCPDMYKMFLLLEETSGIILIIWVQSRQQPTFPSTLLPMIQQYFNESFRQAS